MKKKLLKHQQHEDDSSTWVDETYQFIFNGYQSLIGYYQSLIEQNLAQTSEESENVEAIDVVSDVSADASETDTTTLEAVHPKTPLLIT